jgi:hypothetical protein
MKKREAKLLSKQHAIVKAYNEEGLKPREISKRLRVPIDLVYKTTTKFKATLNSISNQLN